MIVTREIDEFTIEEAKELVEKFVAPHKREGFEFFMMVNKSACLFKNEDKFGLVLGREDGVQATFTFAWVVIRANTTYYDYTLEVT